MALRQLRGPRLRRAARSRSGLVALVCGLYLAAGVVATWPAVKEIRSVYLAGGAPGHGEMAAGDHLQTGYRLWLVGDQLERWRAPGRDPYSFPPEAGAQGDPARGAIGLP